MSSLIDAIFRNAVGDIDPALLSQLINAGLPEDFNLKESEQLLNQKIASMFNGQGSPGLTIKDIKGTAEFARDISPDLVGATGGAAMAGGGIQGALPPMNMPPVNPASGLGGSDVANRTLTEMSRPTNMGTAGVGARGSAANAAPGFGDVAGSIASGYAAAGYSDVLGQKILGAEPGAISAVGPAALVASEFIFPPAAGWASGAAGGGIFGGAAGYFAYEAFKPASAKAKWLSEIKSQVSFAMGEKFNDVFRELDPEKAALLSSDPGLDISSEEFFERMTFGTGGEDYFNGLRNRVSEISKIRSEVEPYGKLVKMRSMDEGAIYTDQEIIDKGLEEIEIESRNAFDLVDELEEMQKFGAMLSLEAGLHPRIGFSRKMEVFKPQIEKLYKYFYLPPPMRSLADKNDYVYTVPVFTQEGGDLFSPPIIDYGLWERSQDKNLSNESWKDMVEDRSLSSVRTEEQRKNLQFAGLGFGLGFYNPSVF